MTERDVTRQASGMTGNLLTPKSFVFVAVCGFGLLVVMECLWIVRLTYGAVSEATDRWSFWNLWAALPLLVLLWAMFNLRWAGAAIRKMNWSIAYQFLGVVLCCGVGGMGLQALFAARSLSDSPITLDYTHLGTQRSAARPAAAPVIAGDAGEGKAIFSVSCITCHGPTGDGLNNLAPSLRASEFVKAADTQAILKVIKQGRAVGDPANKSGKAMPARGGNPFLTDQQAAHLAAFVKSLADGSATTVADSTVDATTPTVQLSRWVVPAAARPPMGLVKLAPDKDLIGSTAFRVRSEARRSALVGTLGLMAIASHGLFLLGLFLATSRLLFGWLLDIQIPRSSQRLRVLTLGWTAATAVWALIWVAFGLW